MLKRLTALAMVAAVGMAMPAMAQDAKKEQPKQTAPKTKEKKSEAASSTLKVGDKAPALSIEEWIKGDEVKKFEEGKVYVVEFWATWCPPCRESIPHLTQLQKEYKDKGVTVIGVASSERGSDKGSKLTTLKKFVGEKKETMAYRVAYDDDRSMSRDWMQPAGQNGIPCAFVVGKDSKIAWIGHPMEGMDDAVKKAVGAGSGHAGHDTAPAIVLVSQEGKQEGKKDKSAQEGGKAKERDMAKHENMPAAEPTKLAMGDKAPAITVEEWVKGEPVTGFEKGKTYVVEYWATWCPPCIKSIPLLTETQKEFKDKVTIIGVASSEHGSDSKKKLEKVKDFVAGKGDEMNYRVAYDDDRSMSKAWLDAAGQNGIPCAFIVNGESKVAWIGNPLSEHEEMVDAIKKINAGKWDIAAEAAKMKEKASKEEADQGKLQELSQQLSDAVQADDPAKIVKAVDAINAAEPRSIPGLAGLKFKNLGRQDATKAYAWAGEAVGTSLKDSAQALNAIAWTIVDPADDTFKKKDFDLALKAGLRADELTKHKDPAITDTVAKVYHDKGDLAKAVELQERAVKLLDDAPEAMRENMEAELKERLQQYKDEAKKRAG
jgi:thiol-disulfide isomerase/thioredoxin